MPIYEYRCAECGFQKEALQKLNDAPLKDCPQCGKPSLAKMVTAAGFQLKGSGWYVTDFKNKGTPKPAANVDSKPDATTATADAAKPETKPKDDSVSAKPAVKADDKVVKPEAAKPVTTSNP